MITYCAQRLVDKYGDVHVTKYKMLNGSPVAFKQYGREVSTYKYIGMCNAIKKDMVQTPQFFTTITQLDYEKD